MALKRLDQQFPFTDKTPIIGNLNMLLVALEARFQALESSKKTLDNLLGDITAIALERMDETFTPLILDAQQRLEQFGANFTAHSVTSNSLTTGLKTFYLDAEDKDGYVYADFVTVRPVGESGSLVANVVAYDRELGKLDIDVIQAIGTGTFTSWDFRMSVEPDLDHATRNDNPHGVTAVQAGAYSIAATDNLFITWTNNLMSQIAPSTYLQKSGNLSGISNYDAARANLGLGTAAVKSTGTSGASVPLLSTGNIWTKPQACEIGLLTTGAYPTLHLYGAWKATIDGSAFNIANPNQPPVYDGTVFTILIDFITPHSISFGNKWKVAGYAPSLSGKDLLAFRYDQEHDQYHLVGVRNRIDA